MKFNELKRDIFNYFEKIRIAKTKGHCERDFLKVNVKSKFTKLNTHMFLKLNISLHKITALVGFLTNDINNISGHSSLNTMYS